MSKKILLLDGLSIANRAFYGIPLLTNQEGLYTNAVYGFLNIMLSMIDKEKPDLVGVAFDVSAPTFRHIKCESYKGTRKGMPAELRPQIPLLKKVLTSMGIGMVEKEGFEADDLLGTLGKQYEKEGYHVVIVSGDRDLLQVTSEHIELKIPKTKQTGTEIESYFAKDVEAKYEVTPEAFIDVKGLMGDASDNIKGVPGVGEKTAVKLIKAYGSIEGIYEHLDEITQKKLKENLETYHEQALESKMLATIVCDVEMDLEGVSFDYNLKLNEETVELFRNLDFKKLIQKLGREESAEPKATLTVQTSDFTTLLNRAKTEVSGWSYFEEDNHIGLSVCVANEVAYGLLDMDAPASKEVLREAFETSQTLKVIHDSKVLRHLLARYEVALEGEVFDTFIAAYLCNPTNETYTIAELGETYLENVHLQTEEDLRGKGKSTKAWLALDGTLAEDTHKQYAYVVRQAYDALKAKLEEDEMMMLFETIEMPLVEVLFEMEREGITIDPEKLKAYGEVLEKLIDETANKIYEVAGETFNINSPKQLGVILFEKMDIPSVKKTKTGYSTAAEVLESLKDDYPIVEDILAYRQYTKLKSTYVDGLLGVMTDNCKIHSTFNQTITATGRISSTEPNLQNIPIKLEMGKRIREVFVPQSDAFVFLDADYSQIELRVLAAMAGDEVLIQAFNEGTDIHRLTASQVFHIPFDEVTPLQRSNAKAVNFGIVYGMGAFSLAQDLGITAKEAGEYIEGYFEKYPKIKKFLDSLVAEASMYGYVETLFHRKREIPEINAKNHNLREFGKRKAMNTPIQGTAADIIKIAMVNVYRALKEKDLRSKLILTVHDELLLEVYKSEEQEVAELLKYQMEHAVDLAVKMAVDVHRGANWLATK